MNQELTKIDDAEIVREDGALVNTRTGEINELAMNDDPVFVGIASAPFDEKTALILTGPVDENLVRIRPDGLIYLPGVQYRRILNRAFGVGAWAMRPLDTRVIGGDKIVVYTGALYVNSRFVAQAAGEHHYQASNGNASYATSLESAKTDCLTRCCKDLGIATELWDTDWIEEWKTRHAVGVWCENIGKGNKEEGKVKKLWRKIDGPPFDYPWKESDHSQRSQSSQQSQSSDAPAPDVAPSEGEEWREHEMSFGKHRGRKLDEMPGEYVGWLTENWTPKGLPGDQHIVAMIAHHRELRKTGMQNARQLTGGTVAERSEPPPVGETKSEEKPEGERPLSPEALKENLVKKATLLDEKIADGRIVPGKSESRPNGRDREESMTAAMASLRGLFLSDDDARRSFLLYVYECDSGKLLTQAECEALIRWVGATKELDGEGNEIWVPNGFSVTEGHAAVAAMREIEHGGTLFTPAKDDSVASMAATTSTQS